MRLGLGLGGRSIGSVGGSVTRAYQYDGTNDVTRCTGIVPALSTGSHSFAFWLRPVAVNKTVLSEFVSLNYHFTHNASGQWDIVLGGFTFGVTRALIATASVAPTQNEWHHYVLTVSGGSVSIIKDGSVEVAAALSSPVNMGTDLCWGAYRGSAPLQAQSGKMRDLRYYATTKLSVANAATIMDGTLLGSETLRYLPTEDSGTTAIDDSGNGNDGSHLSITEETFHTTV